MVEDGRDFFCNSRCYSTEDDHNGETSQKNGKVIVKEERGGVDRMDVRKADEQHLRIDEG